MINESFFEVQKLSPNWRASADTHKPLAARMVVELTASESAFAALKADGSVVCWGVEMPKSLAQERESELDSHTIEIAMN